MLRKIFPIACIMALAACKPQLEAPPASAGPLNLSRYVAVGNSLTAGYADGTLYREGQENSYPVMLAQQFAIVGGGEFKVPFLPKPVGYPELKRVMDYYTDCKGVRSLVPVFEDSSGAAASNMANAINIKADGPFNNTGVPGIRAIDYVIPGYASYNPYARRFFNNINATPLAEINRADATFFTAWIGNNDVLGYALAGGAGQASGGSILDLESISDPTLFQTGVDSVLNRMTANGAKGVVISIPDVTSIPYFTAIPPNGLELTQQEASDLTAHYGGAITFTAGKNYWVVADATVPGIKARQLKAGEYLILRTPQDSLKCAEWGRRKPIGKDYVLDAAEIEEVKKATSLFNSILETAASARGLAFVDMGTYFQSFQSGVSFNGVTYTTEFVTGGAFSLDGIHLTPRGYALAANHIIRTINAYYKSAIPTLDVNKYRGVKFP